MTRPLRIALCCQQDVTLHPLPAYRFWAEYLRQGLAEAGHFVLECPGCDWAEGLLPLEEAQRHAWSERTWTRYLAWLRLEHAREPVDIALSYLYPNQVDETGLGVLRDLGIPSVNFFCDNVREFRRIPKTFQRFDLHWVPEFKAMRLYEVAGYACVHAPMPCYVPREMRAAPTREALPITFVGTRDEQREQLFATAIQRGLKLELRGKGWGAPANTHLPLHRAATPAELVCRQWKFVNDHGWHALWRKSLRRARPSAMDFCPFAKPSPVGVEYWAALRESTVCLGVNRYPSFRHSFNKPDSYSRLRDLEAPMVGACYLTEWTEGLDRLYDLGSEIETYTGATELVEKAKALASDSQKRARLRAAGQRRALSCHTVAQTIHTIATKLGITR